MSHIKVLLVEDDPDWIKAMTAFLNNESDILVVGAATGGEEQLKDLTPAEREVFELIERGHTQPQIEQKLYKTESTLKNQVNKILKKLGVRSSKEAVEKVRRKGLK